MVVVVMAIYTCRRDQPTATRHAVEPTWHGGDGPGRGEPNEKGVTRQHPVGPIVGTGVPELVITPGRFSTAFDAFRRDAGISEPEAQAVLAVLYDAQVNLVAMDE